MHGRVGSTRSLAMMNRDDGGDAIELATRLGKELTRRGWMLGTAESCTGGLLAGAITSVPGASRWFDRGYVTYSNEAKAVDLQVPTETIDSFGAVSEPVAVEMANGVLLASRVSHIAVSTTGIAGPEGGTPGKPVGLVCFGFAMRAGDGITTLAATHVFQGDRAQVRQASVVFALRGVLEMMGVRETELDAV
ncbi:damage-inducible protein CinA [Bordetella genomosp. 10]|uniref:Damage-inducible protein CinA n=2 Tax=Bordetella genomosp. 10 TaxID=1416804 RepID=A0A261SJL2_9BORD|nr:damage-inducible protein CinA [Bordetella genomosp. 10]